MSEYLFPNATQELVALLQHTKNKEQQIDIFLQHFGVKCAQAFLTSLTHAPALFSDDELLERMKEQQKQ